MPTTADLDNIQLQAYDIVWDNQDLGFTTVDSLVINQGEQVINVDNADQLEGIIKQFSKGYVFSVTVSLKRSDFDFIYGKLMQSKATLVQGSGGEKYYSVRNQIFDNVDLSKILKLHPSNLSATDRSKDIYFPKAFPTLEDFNLVGSRDTVQEVSITFTIFPDLDNNDESARFGDWTAVASNPLGVWLSTDDNPQVPGKHVDAMTISAQSTHQINGFALFGTTTGTATAAIDNGAGYTATDTSLVFDGLSSANAILDNSYVEIGSEIIYVESVSYTSTTEGTLTVVRGVAGSTAASITDNDAITVIDEVAVINANDSGSWASSSASNVTVGDTVSGTGTDKSGVIAHVAAGSADITLTVPSGGTASPNLAVTAS